MDMKRYVPKADRSFMLFALPVAVALLTNVQPAQAGQIEAHICSCGVTCGNACATVCCEDE